MCARTSVKASSPPAEAPNPTTVQWLFCGGGSEGSGGPGFTSCGPFLRGRFSADFLDAILPSGGWTPAVSDGIKTVHPRHERRGYGALAVPAAALLMRHFPERYSPLEHLVDVMCLVVDHVLDLEMHVVI